MWLLAEDWQVIIYRLMYRWINIWLNVVEHVMIEFTGMMNWPESIQHSSWRSTTQCNMRSWVTINRLVIVCNEWWFTGVIDSWSLCRDKLHFSQTALCGIYNAVLSNPMCNRTWPGPTRLWGQQYESSIGFQLRNDSQDYLHFQACRTSHSHVGQEESSQGEELGAILQPGRWHTGRA